MERRETRSKTNLSKLEEHEKNSNMMSNDACTCGTRKKYNWKLSWVSSAETTIFFAFHAQNISVSEHVKLDTFKSVSAFISEGVENVMQLQKKEKRVWFSSSLGK